MLTETKHNHKVLPILTKTLNPLKSGIQSLQKDTNEEGIKRRETLNHCVVQLKHRIRFTLFSAKLFPINRYIFFFSFYLHTLYVAHKICSWPKSSLFHSLAQRQKEVSLIWSSCSQTVSTSRSLLVTANFTAAALFETPPPFGFLNFFSIKMNETPAWGAISFSFFLPSIMGENGGEIFGLIWYCMEHTTSTL